MHPGVAAASAEKRLMAEGRSPSSAWLSSSDMPPPSIVGVIWNYPEIAVCLCDCLGEL
jgi:hypothetical protein